VGREVHTGSRTNESMSKPQSPCREQTVEVSGRYEGRRRRQGVYYQVRLTRCARLVRHAGTPGIRPRGTSRLEGLPHGSLPAMPELLATLDAFLQEHRRCGDLDGVPTVT
jgi:hypothetical protein